MPEPIPTPPRHATNVSNKAIHHLFHPGERQDADLIPLYNHIPPLEFQVTVYEGQAYKGERMVMNDIRAWIIENKAQYSIRSKDTGHYTLGFNTPELAIECKMKFG